MVGDEGVDSCPLSLIDYLRQNSLWRVRLRLEAKRMISDN